MNVSAWQPSSSVCILQKRSYISLISHTSVSEADSYRPTSVRMVRLTAMNLVGVLMRKVSQLMPNVSKIRSPEGGLHGGLAAGSLADYGIPRRHDTTPHGQQFPCIR